MRHLILLLCALAALAQNRPVLSPGAVVDAASFGQVIAPGMLITVFGKSFTARAAEAETIPLPTTLDGVSVEVEDGSRTVQAPLLMVSPTQINAQMPEFSPGLPLNLRVRNGAGVSDPQPILLVDRAPRLFTFTMDGIGDAIAVHSDYVPVSSDNPASAGEVVLLYATGLGDVNAAGFVTAPVDITVDNIPADVQYAGVAPGYPGVYQVNFTVPDIVGAGNFDVALLAGGRKSQPGVRTATANPKTPREFYVAPNGTPEGDGSRENPWDLATALAPAPAVRPGDTIWVRGGAYGDGARIFKSYLAGSSSRPIRVRQYPGERAIINGGLATYSPYVWYWGLEVTNTNPDRGASRNAPECVDTYDGSVGVKLINMVLHDCSQGIGLWTPAENAEAYGNLIYYNGWQGPAPDRGHGHGIYTQNANGTKVISDNIIFDQFGLGIQAYGSSSSSVKGYNVRGNIIFNNGVISRDATNVDNILFAIGAPMERICIENNYTYHTPDQNKGYSRIGWSFSTAANKDAVVRGNYWIGGQSAIELWNWRQATFTGNITYSKSAINAILAPLPGQSGENYDWDHNEYYGNGVFRVDADQNRRWDDWRKLSGFDSNSRLIAGAPTGIWSFVRPNKYETGRANIVIYNWDRADTVPVNVSEVLSKGDRYEILDAENYFGAPVASGTYDGKPVAIKMTGLKAAAPVGNVPAPPVHTLPEFGAYILRKK